MLERANIEISKNSIVEPSGCNLCKIAFSESTVDQTLAGSRIRTWAFIVKFQSPYKNFTENFTRVFFKFKM